MFSPGVSCLTSEKSCASLTALCEVCTAVKRWSCSMLLAYSTSINCNSHFWKAWHVRLQSYCFTEGFSFSNFHQVCPRTPSVQSNPAHASGIRVTSWKEQAPPRSILVISFGSQPGSEAPPKVATQTQTWLYHALLKGIPFWMWSPLFLSRPCMEFYFAPIPINMGTIKHKGRGPVNLLIKQDNSTSENASCISKLSHCHHHFKVLPLLSLPDTQAHTFLPCPCTQDDLGWFLGATGGWAGGEAALKSMIAVSRHLIL